MGHKNNTNSQQTHPTTITTIMPKPKLQANLATQFQSSSIEERKWELRVWDFKRTDDSESLRLGFGLNREKREGFVVRNLSTVGLEKGQDLRWLMKTRHQGSMAMSSEQ